MHIAKPEAGEYDLYSIRYIDLVPDDGSLFQHLKANTGTMLTFLRSLSHEQWSFRYAEGKWTVKEMLLHIIDSERIFAYRALRIARGDTTPLSGFDQDPYVPASDANSRSAESLMDEYSSVRNATMTLFENLPSHAWMNKGTANNKTVSVRAIAYILTGHELHHRAVLNERYFPVGK